jgi:hypothetical protein
MDRNEAKKVSDLMRKALTDVLKREGYDVTIEGGVFSSDSFHPKVIVSKSGVDLEKKEFERNAHLFGLKSEHYGCEIVSNGLRFVLVGLNPGRPKFPVSAKRLSDGKKFKLTAAALYSLKS